jgi:hypothetical protein
MNMKPIIMMLSGLCLLGGMTVVTTPITLLFIGLGLVGFASAARGMKPQS